ncbi:hypothetical protein TNCV_845931 [Trichonephila clavipes]|nr:hypothetical protein TNCV_845931 [Trichonephila clavipes]
MFIIILHNCSAYELSSPVAAYQPLDVGEDILPDSKFVLAENGRGVSDFRLTVHKRSHDSFLGNEQQPLDFTRIYQPQCSRYFLPSMDCSQLFVNQHHVW